MQLRKSSQALSRKRLSRSSLKSTFKLAVCQDGCPYVNCLKKWLFVVLKEPLSSILIISNVQVGCFPNSVCETTWLSSVGNAHDYIKGSLKKKHLLQKINEMVR